MLNPTTENISKIIYDRLKNTLPSGVRVSSVTTWESDSCGAVYYE
ncbi:MAG: 6-carboxytetrahydropterin synthase [Candidatus Brocadiales bacterium]|nr:6-carboxytetrahydropterin synthase [Candidatus Brocadiales bacterium]